MSADHSFMPADFLVMHHSSVIRMMAISTVMAFSLTGCSGLGTSRLDTRISRGQFFKWPSSSTAAVAKRETQEDPFLPEPNTAVATKTQKKSPETESGLSTESLVLFETEFRDATPQERQEWMEHIKSVPPEMVPQILQARRLALQRSSLVNNQAPRGESTYTDRSIVSGHTINNVSPWGSQTNGQNHLTASYDSPDQGGYSSRGTMVSPVGFGELENIDPNDPAASSENARQVSLQNNFHAPSPLERRMMQSQGQEISPGLPGSPRRDRFVDQQMQLVDGVLPPSNSAPMTDGATMPLINSGFSREAATPQSMNSTPIIMGTAAASGDPSSWNLQLSQLISLAEAEAAGLPPGTTPEQRRNYIAKHVYLRMLYLMGDQQVRALTAIEGIDTADQEFWQQMFWAMSNYFDEKGLPDASDRASQTIAQLTSAIDRLQQQARLELHNVSFSHKIDGFGNFQRFSRDEFKAGQPVLLYAELRNFKSEPNSEGMFRTTVKSRIEIFKAGPAGGLVYTQDFPPTEDLSSSLRHDYYHSYLLHLPETLTLGPHVLKLTVEDLQSQKLATYSLRFGVN